MCICCRRVVEEMVLFLGAAVGYYSGDTRRLLDDAKELRPTVFAGVPRVYERVYSGVLDKVRRGVGGCLCVEHELLQQLSVLVTAAALQMGKARVQRRAGEGAAWCGGLLV